MLNQRRPGSAAMFSLVKWYGDCVSDEGRAFIGYWAELRWRGLHIHYGSRLEARPGVVPQTTTTLRAGQAPHQDGDGYAWAEPLLGLEARWKPSAPPYTATLFASGAGEVRWTCLTPAAQVEVWLDPGQNIRGLGYLERLDLTLPPWSLPLHALRWGRYLAADESLVWIDWQGEHQSRLVLRRGYPVEAADVDDAALTLHSGERLLCGRDLTLREGGLGPNVLSAIRMLDRLVPARLLQLHEHKWLSHGELSLNQRILSRGWAVHEVVSWPNDFKP